MKHIISTIDDVPPPQPLLERRSGRDRRKTWRGGRRDSDWQLRPAGTLDLMDREARRHQSLPRRVLSVLHLW